MRNTYNRLVRFLETHPVAEGTMGMLAAILVVVIGSSLIIWATAPEVPPPPPTPTTEQRAVEATVVVDLLENNEVVGHGSGVIIGKDLVLTNKHVAELTVGKDRSGKVRFSNGGFAAPRLLWLGHDNLDIALLSVDTGQRTAVPMSCEVPVRGTEIMAVGHPKYEEYMATYGRVAGPNSHPELDKVIADAVILDLTLYSGNSGGGVFTKDGTLVGLATAIIPSIGSMFGVAPTGLSIMIPTATACTLLGR